MMRWSLHIFETIPSGRILNRFAKDIDSIDTVLPQLVSDFIYCCFDVYCLFFLSKYSSNVEVLLEIIKHN